MPAHDSEALRRGVRRGPERGCWLYVTGEQLRALGLDPRDPPPRYRIWTARGRPRLVVNLYREP